MQRYSQAIKLLQHRVACVWNFYWALLLKDFLATSLTHTDTHTKTHLLRPITCQDVMHWLSLDVLSSLFFWGWNMRGQNSFHIQNYWSLLRDRCKCDLHSPLCPNPECCFTPAVMWPQGVKGRSEEAGRVRVEEGVAVVVPMAETWSERCWPVGMWNMFSDITVWIISHKPSNPFGPARHHRPARTARLVWLVLDWSGPSPSLQEGGDGVLRVRRKLVQRENMGLHVEVQPRKMRW